MVSTIGNADRQITEQSNGLKYFYLILTFMLNINKGNGNERSLYISLSSNTETLPSDSLESYPR